MKKFVVSALIILMCTLPILTGCNQKPSNGGSVLDPGFKLVEEKEPPASGTPDDYDALDNVAYAAYKFNRASSWEAVYSGTVTAAGTKQRVENLRQYDGSALFAQAISASGIKSTAEQKYFNGDNILHRTSTGIDKKNLTVTWSNKITKLSTEDYFRDYGLIPNEIFKYVVDKTTVTSIEKVQSNNYKYKMVLSTDCAKYLKNEVRTMAGSKSDPTFLSIECTIEIDKNWNVIRTTSQESYKIALLGGVTCKSTATEEFTIGKKVTIKDKSLFESATPGDPNGKSEQPKQPMDYLTSAFNNLDENGNINLSAQIGSMDSQISLQTKTGTFALKLGDTVVKNTGTKMYILGDEAKVKFDMLSFYEALYIIIPTLSADTGIALPANAPELGMLMDELMNTINGKENSDEAEMINKLLESIDMTETKDGAIVTLDFTLDNIVFDIDIDVVKDKLALLCADIAYNGQSFNIQLAPATRTIDADISGAHDISRLVKAISKTVQEGRISLKNDNTILTINNGDVILNTQIEGNDVKAKYGDNKVMLDAMNKKFSLNTDAFSFFNSKLGLGDILGIAASLANLPFEASVQADENELTFNFAIGEAYVKLLLSASDKLDISLNIDNSVSFVSTDEMAEMDETGDFVVLDSIAYFIENIIENDGIDLVLNATADKYASTIEFSTSISNKYAVVKTDDVILQATDALYILGNNLKGKIDFDAFDSSELVSSAFALSGELNFDLLPVLGIINDADIRNDGSAIVIEYTGSLFGAEITVNARISDTLTLSGNVIYDDKEYSISVANTSNRLEPVSTEGCITLDPIIYFAREMLFGAPTLDVSISLGDTVINAAIMPDLANGSFVAKIGNAYLAAYDKIYLKNDYGCYAISYETIMDMLVAEGKAMAEMDNEFNYDDIISLISGLILKSSIKQEGSLLKADFSLDNVSVEMEFDYATNFLAHATITSDIFEIQIAMFSETFARPSFDDAVSIDNLSELISPIKDLLNQKQITIAIDELNVAGDTPLSISGSIGINLENEPELYINLTFIEDGELNNHNLKANYINGNIDAAYTYTIVTIESEATEDEPATMTETSDTLKINITADAIFTIALNITDIIGLKLDILEQLRPEGTNEVKSDIIYSALPDSFKDTILDLILAVEESSEAGIDINELLSYLDKIKLSGQEDQVTITVYGENELTLSLAYSETIDSIGIDTDGFNAALQLSYTTLPVVIPEGKSFDLNSLPTMLDYALNTVNLGKYTVEGNVNLNAFSFLNIDIPFRLVAEIDEDYNPLVYVKLEVPYFDMNLLLVHYAITRADSYIFFYDGIMYLKSDHYERKRTGGTLLKPTYDYIHTETLYTKCTPNEFGADIVEYLSFLIPMNDGLKNTINDSIANSTLGDPNYAKAFTEYAYDAEKEIFNLGIDLSSLTGNDALGALTLNLTAGEDNDSNKIFEKFTVNMKMLRELVQLNLNANLVVDYDGTIIYGYNENDQAPTDITEMQKTLQSLIPLHEDWQ